MLDEIEKAHPDVFNILLQVLDDGRLTDSKGRVVDFKNTILIMTSNIGSQYLLQGNNETTRLQIKQELNQYFKPEFINRIDDIVFFNSLDSSIINKITKKFIDDLAIRLNKKQIELIVKDNAISQISKEGFDSNYGARPLKRYIQNNIENPIAYKIISGEIKEKSKLSIDYKNNEFTFETTI